ncbi:MAG TPA: hypothetical protein DD732_04530 [Rhizobiales bacterium]|nr:hypothetical protein [Hyphomicrobiales bacterium]
MLALWLVACAAVGGQARAVENGNPQWPIGVQTIIPAILPAAGETAYFNYTLYYHADSFKDGNGNNLVPGFEASVLAEAPRIVHTWETKLGPLNMSTGVILVGNFVNVEADPAPGLHLEDSTTGLNFLYLTPLYLTYNTPTLHLLYGPSAIIPVGPFSEHDLANPTNNYYSFHQEFAATYFPMKTLEISAEAGLTFNAKNPATDYQSGATFDIDWGINWAPIASMPNLFFGIQGFYVTQFTDCEINNVTVAPGGFRLEKIALGPQLIYYFSPKAGIAAKYQREFDTENGPEGDRFWIQFVVPIGHISPG